MLRLFLLSLAGMLVSSAAISSEWHFASIDGTVAKGGTEVLFNEDGSLQGSTGCSQFTGLWSYIDDALVLEQPLASTKRLCGDQEVDAQEVALLELLNGQIAVDYDPFLEQLMLTANNRSAVLKPGPVVADELPGIFSAQNVVVTGVSNLLNLRSEPTTSSDVVSRLRPGSIHASLGCERLPDRNWCRLSLETGVEGWAAAEYLVPLTLGSRVKGGNYDKIGRLECSDADGSNVGRCEYGASQDSGHAIVAAFVDSGAPVILHFRDGVFDPIASFGPFRQDYSSEVLDDAVRFIVEGARLDVPYRAFRL